MTKLEQIRADIVARKSMPYMEQCIKDAPPVHNERPWTCSITEEQMYLNLEAEKKQREANVVSAKEHNKSVWALLK